MKYKGAAMLDISREELREDIREITTEVVKKSQRTIITMVNEDIVALRNEMRGDMKRMERRLGRKIDTAIAAHNADPRAHRARS